MTSASWRVRSFDQVSSSPTSVRGVMSTTVARLHTQTVSGSCSGLLRSLHALRRRHSCRGAWPPPRRYPASSWRQGRELASLLQPHVSGGTSAGVAVNRPLTRRLGVWDLCGAGGTLSRAFSCFAVVPYTQTLPASSATCLHQVQRACPQSLTLPAVRHSVFASRRKPALGASGCKERGRFISFGSAKQLKLASARLWSQPVERVNEIRT